MTLQPKQCMDRDIFCCSPGEDPWQPCGGLGMSSCISPLSPHLLHLSIPPGTPQTSVSPALQCFGKPGLGSTLGYPWPKCERLQAMTFDDSVLEFSSAGPVEHPKTPSHFFKSLVTIFPVTDPQVGSPLSQPIVLLSNSISAALELGNRSAARFSHL